jgi:hypothetical protein
MRQPDIDAAYLKGKAILLRGLAADTTLPLSVELENLAAELEAYAADIERRAGSASRLPKRSKKR